MHHLLLNNQEPQAKASDEKKQTVFLHTCKSSTNNFFIHAFKDALSHVFSLSIFLFITFPADAPLQQTPRILSVVPL